MANPPIRKRIKDSPVRYVRGPRTAGLPRTHGGLPIPAPATKTPVILIADDEPDILESLRDLLEDAVPAQCILANSGTQALEIIGKRPIDLILSDYKMPGLNGIQFLEQARLLLPDVPRILITAFPDLEVAIDAINQARVEAFLIKPLDPDQVVERVRQALTTPTYKGAR